MKYLFTIGMVGLCLQTCAYAQTSGPLANAPTNVPDGSLYIATDQTTCSPLYLKLNGSWTQAISVGGSGALSCANGTLEITSQVPRLNAANKWAGLQQFAGGVAGVSGTTTSTGPVTPVALPTLSINGQPQQSRSTINIVGQGVAASDDGTTLTITLPANPPSSSVNSLSSASQSAAGTVTLSSTQSEVPLIVQGGNGVGVNLYLRPTAPGAHTVHYFSNTTGVGLWDEANGGGYVYNVANGTFAMNRALQLQHGSGGPCTVAQRSTFANEESPFGHDHVKMCQQISPGVFVWTYLN